MKIQLVIIHTVQFPDVPGPPTGPLEISDIGRFSVNLSWSPPKEDGGSKIEYYTIEKREKGRKLWMVVTTYATSTSYSVEGLSENMEYEFRVSAENINGVGSPLEGKEAVICKSLYCES